jgi:hypothetical protein
LNNKSIFLVLLFLSLTAFSWLSYSVLIPANPMPLTSPTFVLNSNTARLLYVREVVLGLSGTSVTQVSVVVFNNMAAVSQSATVTVQIYDWNGNLVSQGSEVVSVPARGTATAIVNLSPSVLYSSVGRVVASVS